MWPPSHRLSALTRLYNIAKQVRPNLAKEPVKDNMATQHHHHLHIPMIRVGAKRNHKYRLNGKGSYLSAIRKYGFNPPYVSLRPA